MENTDADKSQAKPNPLRAFWPDVSTEKGVQDAIKAGALSILYLAIAYTIYTVRIGSVFLIADDDTLNLVQEQFSLTGNLIFSAGGIVPALVLAWLVWKRYSLVAMWIGFAWLALDLGVRFALAPATPGRLLIAGLVAVACGLHGLRGVSAARRATSAAPAEA